MFLWNWVLFASLLGLNLGLIVASRRWGGAKVDEWLFRHRDHLPIPFLSIGILAHLTSKGLTPTPERGWMNLLGIFLVILGESLRIWAVGIVGAATRSKSTNAKRLVQEGPYAVIRNPIYAGNFLLCFGLACFLHSWAALLACVLYFIVVYDRIIRSEEKFLQATFGSVYETYCRFVPRIVPRWGWSWQALRAPFRLKELRKEYWTVTGIACAVLIAHFMTFQPLHDWLADRLRSLRHRSRSSMGRRV